MGEYEKLLKRLEKAEKFFLDENISDERKLKFVDEFNRIQKRIAEIERSNNG